MSSRQLLSFAPVFALSILAVSGCKSLGMSSSTDPVAAQIAYGGDVYAQNCAKCHGDAGQGSDRAPALVGSGALPLEAPAGAKRSDDFRSAMDIAVFATQNMPPKSAAREMLSATDYWAVLAFALSANGVHLSEPVSPENAAAIILHP